jgi:hypothetical protein
VSLISEALPFSPRLIFLNPGEAQCLSYCRQRPWEPHKYKSREEQNRNLDALLVWVSAYYTRDGDMSLEAHEACYRNYPGPKTFMTSAVELDPPNDEVLTWVL